MRIGEASNPGPPAGPRKTYRKRQQRELVKLAPSVMRQIVEQVVIAMNQSQQFFQHADPEMPAPKNEQKRRKKNRVETSEAFMCDPPENHVADQTHDIWHWYQQQSEKDQNSVWWPQNTEEDRWSPSEWKAWKKWTYSDRQDWEPYPDDSNRDVSAWPLLPQPQRNNQGSRFAERLNPKEWTGQPKKGQKRQNQDAKKPKPKKENQKKTLF